MFWFVLIITLAAACFLIYKEFNKNKKQQLDSEKYVPRPKIPGTFRGANSSNNISTHNVKKTNPNVIKIVGRIKKDPENGYEFDIVGESFCQSALLDIVGGKSEDSVEILKPAVVVRDLSNTYDANAVAVYIDESRVGYIAKDEAKEFCDAIKRSGFDSNSAFDVQAMIVGGWKRGNGDEGKFGVRLNVDPDLGITKFTRY